MWRQRSRKKWLRWGDKNTSFFHLSATQRRRRNLISEIKDNHGNRYNSEEDIARTFEDHFVSLFSSSHPTEFDSALSGVDRVVTDEMNAELVREFTAEEVDTALKQMAPSTAPGPDGMSPLFYQSCWDLVGSDVSQAILSCLNSGSLLKAVNHTYITLIPKTQTPQKVSDFRPISLCNVIYKILSKVITNRLKHILPKIISETQSAFVPGRLITDNILVAFETLHHMKTARSGRPGFMALKLDMSKAYDRVKWAFLKQIMIKMGFANQWVNLVLECISTVSFSILINGAPRGFFRPSRGLRQGDPLSPYLFLLCTEGLHGLINKVINDHVIRDISLNRGGPVISHLFFADDSLLFCRATRDDCEAIL